MPEFGRILPHFSLWRALSKIGFRLGYFYGKLRRRCLLFFPDGSRAATADLRQKVGPAFRESSGNGADFLACLKNGRLVEVPGEKAERVFPENPVGDFRPKRVFQQIVQPAHFVGRANAGSHDAAVEVGADGKNMLAAEM